MSNERHDNDSDRQLARKLRLLHIITKEQQHAHARKLEIILVVSPSNIRKYTANIDSHSSSCI